VPAKAAPPAQQFAQAMSGLGQGLAQALGKGGASAPVATGPVVKIARGNDVTVVPVGAR
jgi:pilus assembly protein CpaB